MSETEERKLLRLHLEAVWGIRLPILTQSEIVPLPWSEKPKWKLCLAELESTGERISVWHQGVSLEDRPDLLASLQNAIAAPEVGPWPEGVKREVVLHQIAEPQMSLGLARRLARPLSKQRDMGLVETFDPNGKRILRDKARSPHVGIVMDGLLLSLAYSARSIPEACELSIETRPGFQRRGYGLAATLVWGDMVCQNGRLPLYSALATNIASLALAHKAGYRPFARTIRIE
jgi:hypothetical protein